MKNKKRNLEFIVYCLLSLAFITFSIFGLKVWLTDVYVSRPFVYYSASISGTLAGVAFYTMNTLEYHYKYVKWILQGLSVILFILLLKTCFTSDIVINIISTLKN